MTPKEREYIANAGARGQAAAAEDYIPPVLDARRAGPAAPWVRRPTPPTVRPAADPCAEFEALVKQEGEGYARLVNVARAAGVK